ncbi:MAG: hypothetical protein KDC44_05375, partial [Phaeodactylibacter sp.]|nr:hypothetical protein [Phaeodactylibacter sp.]
MTDPENGCTATDQVQVELDDASPTAIAGTSNSLTCQNTTATLSAEGSSIGRTILYTWQDADGMPLGNAATLSINQPGSYLLVVTDTLNGCFTVAETTAVQDTLCPLADAGAPDTITCSVNSILLDGSGSAAGSAFSYTWLDENGQLIATTLSTPVSQPGTYSLEVVNLTNGCLETAAVVIAQDTLAPLAQLQTSGPIDCVTPAVTLQAAGPTTGDNILFEWQKEAGIFLGNAATLSVNQAGLYTLMLTNSENGCTAGATAVVLEDLEAPLAQITPPDTITCADPLVLVDASSSSAGPTISVEWLNPANQIIANALSIETDLAGSYQLTVTDNSNGCTATAETVVVADVHPPDFQFAPTPQLNCLNPVVNLNALGFPSDIPLDFQWLDGNGLVIGTNPDIVIDATATYMLVLTNLNTGCFTTDSITVTQDITPPIAEAGIGDTLTCDQLPVSLNGSTGSGGPSFAYLWQNA